MKKLLIIILACMIVLSLFGCGGDTQVNVNAENRDELSGSKFGESAMVKIGGGLYYDSTTRIVYWWNGSLDNSYGAVTPAPYYAPNGLPYLYDPVTNTFIEIKE